MDTEPVLPESLAEAHAIIRELWAAVQALRTEQGQLRSRLAALEARLGQNSSNSSRPPWSDPPWTPPLARQAAAQ